MEQAARRLVDRQIRDILAGMLEGEPDRSEECLRMGREAGLWRKAASTIRYCCGRQC